MPAMQLRVAKKKKSKSSCKEFNTLFYLLSLSQITSVFVLWREAKLSVSAEKERAMLNRYQLWASGSCEIQSSKRVLYDFRFHLYTIFQVCWRAKGHFNFPPTKTKQKKIKKKKTRRNEVKVYHINYMQKNLLFNGAVPWVYRPGRWELAVQLIVVLHLCCLK